MRKKIFAFALGALLLAACSQDEALMGAQSEEEVTVRYAVSLDRNSQTRADFTMGSGTKVDKLYCAVYEKGGTDEAPTYDFIKNETVGVNGSGATVFTYEPVLLKGHTYVIAFWAMKEGAYTLSDDLQTISIPASTAGNNDGMDAFTATDEVTVPSNIPTKTVNLSRPFGQVNFFTTATDLADALALAKVAATATVTSSVTVGVNNIPTAYNALTGEVTRSTSAGTYTFTATDVPTGEYTIEGVAYIPLATNYALPAGESSITTCTLKVLADGKEVNSLSINNFPIHANKRTNVYGQLLTGTQKYSVSVNDEFTTPDKNKEVDE